MEEMPTTLEVLQEILNLLKVSSPKRRRKIEKRDLPVVHLFALADVYLQEECKKKKLDPSQITKDMVVLWAFGKGSVEDFIQRFSPSSLQFRLEQELRLSNNEPKESKIKRAKILVDALKKVGLWEP